jgi:hypothetical protein
LCDPYFNVPWCDLAPRYDVVYVRVTESKGGDVSGSDGRTRARTTAAQAQLRVRPTVQGATLLENKTGRILAMAGSFSYPLSQLNRTSQTGVVHLGAARLIYAGLIVLAITTGLLLGLALLGASLPVDPAGRSVPLWMDVMPPASRQPPIPSSSPRH